MPPSPESVIALAKAKGYKRDAYKDQDGQTKLERYRSNTTAMHATVLQRFAIWYWGRLRDEAELSGATPPDFESARHLLLRRGAPAPSLTEAKDFFRFYIESSKGRIAKNGKPTAESMVGIAEVFYRAFTCETQTDTSVAQRSEVYHWLRHVLTAHRVIEDKKKPKHNLDVVALDRILHVIWSGLNVDHERMRIQLHFILMIYATTGARAGALFAGKVTYRVRDPEITHAALRLIGQDIELVQKRKPEGDGYFFFFRFDQRFVKNNRNVENQTFGTTMHEHPVLLHNMEALLEALIFADNALFGLESLEDLWDLDIVPGDNENILRWNEEVLDLPILRKIERDGTVSKEQMSLEVFQRAFRKILDLAGYIDVAASVHQIRRHLGKKIDERYTEVQRSQHITQSDVRIFGASYVANCSSVDGLSAFFGENPDHTAVEFFQGIEKFREQGAPTTLPAASERALWQNGEVVALEKELTLVKGSSKERQVSSALHSLRRRLRSNALTEYRRNWVRERRDWKVLTRGKVQPALGPVRSNQLTPFIPELERVERLMVSMSKLGKLSMRQAVQDLYSLASKDCTVLYYPGEEPIGGGCRFCGTDLSKIQLRSRSSHTHACNKKHVAAEQRVLPKDMRFCHDCAEWFVKGEPWDKHCHSHLQPPSKICGSMESRRTVVRPAYCPWCLAAEGKSPAERLTSWKRDADVVRHIKQEEVRDIYPAFCPLCSETLEHEEALECHLSDAHILKVAARGGRAQKTKTTREVSALACKTPVGSQPSPEVEETNLKSTEAGAIFCTEDEIPWCPPKTPVHGELFLTENAVLEDEFMESCLHFPPSPQPLDWTFSSSDTEYVASPDGVSGLLGSTSSVASASSEPEEDISRPKKVRIILRSGAGGIHRSAISAEYESTPPSQGVAHAGDSQPMLIDPSLLTGEECDDIVPRSDSPLPQSTIQRQPATKDDVDETFTVDRILGRWGKNLFFLRWVDGTCSWEPRENLLDNDLVETFEKEYEGFENGVQVLKTRFRKRKTEYKIRWDGRPHKEDTWVAEKDMSQNLVCRHKPPTKSQKSKRKRA